MRGNTRLIVGGIGAVVVGAVVVVCVQQAESTTPRTPISAGQVEAEDAVARSLTDCTFLAKPGDPRGPDTVVVISRTGAMAGASLPPTVFTALRENTGGVGGPVGSVTLITVGGAGERPRVVLNRAALTYPKAGAAQANRLATKLPSCLSTALDATASAQRAGSDELLAQQVAARAATSTVLVVSDGEVNAGLLDLRDQPYPGGDPVDSVAGISARGQLPKFAGRDVGYFGIGQNRSDVKHPVPGDPPLTPVTAIATGPVPRYVVDSASFQPDSTELVDPAAGTGAVRAVAATAERTGARHLSVTGHACADGSPTSSLRQISLERARAIERMLRGVGVTASISARGLGADEPAQGPAPDGSYTSAQCAANRRVEIVVG